MKRSLKIALCFALILGCLAGLFACGSSSSSATPATTAPARQAITGRYELMSITYEDGVVSSGETLEYTMSVMGDIYLELYSDYSAIFCLFGKSKEMDYSESRIWDPAYGKDSQLWSYEFSVGDGEAVLNYDGDIFTFKKQ